MTEEGIIQKIFNNFSEYILSHSDFIGYEFKDTNDVEIITKNELERLKRELIEKIELVHPLHDSAFCSACEIKRYLIGDTK